MGDTLRCIVEGMGHEPNMMDYDVPRSCLPTCPKCRLEAQRIDQLTECINTLKARDAKIRKLLGNMEHAKIYREGARQDHQLFPDTGDECLVCQILALLDGQPEEGKRG